MADQANGLFSFWLREKRIATALPHIHGTVLDFGCGIGYLAKFINEKNYVGIDLDVESLLLAKQYKPTHKFMSNLELMKGNTKFATIILAAVIEHVDNPVQLIIDLEKHLDYDGTFIITTPAPWAKRLLQLGSKLGLLSSMADEEHKALIGYNDLLRICKATDYKIQEYKLFLFGMNQLAILRKNIVRNH